MFGLFGDRHRIKADVSISQMMFIALHRLLFPWKINIEGVILGNLKFW